MTAHSRVLAKTALDAGHSKPPLLAVRSEDRPWVRPDEDLAALVMRATGDLIWDWDVPTNGLSWNDKITSSFGYAPEDVAPTLQWWIDRIHPDDRHAVVSHIMEIQHQNVAQFSADYRWRRADGTYACIHDRGYIVRDDTGRALRGVGAMQDVTAQTEFQKTLVRTEALNRSIIEANPDCLTVLDPAGNVLFSNKAAAHAYGLANDDLLIGRRWGERLLEHMRVELDAALAAAQSGTVARLALHIPGSDGELRWYESLVSPIYAFDGALTHFIVMSRDITTHKSAESKVRWAATHDPLTKLPNRALFQERLDALIARASGSGLGFALLVLDLDEFKRINDTLGHDAGDAMLCAAAKRLTGAVSSGDFVARLGGDEFAILLASAPTEAAATTLAEAILAELQHPWIRSGRIFDCPASIGVGVFGCHGRTSGELLKNADVALYAAKAQGRSRVVVFKRSMQTCIRKRFEMLGLARQAVADDLVIPYYQPKVDLMSGAIVGFEALLRVRHPTRGILAPAEILPALDDINLAADIGDRMITLVLTDLRRWLDAGLQVGHIAVNAAAADFRRGSFADRFLEQLHRHGVPADHLQVEVTETVFLGTGTKYVETALRQLSESGVRIALDDFGTGYASLAHLQQFPIDILKIDRSFVSKMMQDRRDAAIVGAVISLGRNLGLQVVAEGVETSEQAARLLEQECQIAQGYLFGKAMIAARVPVETKQRPAVVASLSASRLAQGIRSLSQTS